MSAHEGRDAERVRDRLTTERYGRSLSWLALTDSTNDDAKRAAEAGARDGHVIVADAQRRGRGSHGRTWSSPEADDLYVSIVARPQVAFAALPPLTLAVGLGVAHAVDALRGETAPAPSRVKWPNDVQLDGKKVAGILVEASASGATLDSLVIGIGLNVNRAEFVDELAPHATSLRMAHPDRISIDRVHALCEVLAHVEAWVDRFARDGADAIACALSSRLALLGEPARCGDTVGIVRGVTPQGALLMETANGMKELIAGRLMPERQR